MKRKRAFTLVELFVVFAALVLLASVLVPVLQESRSAARIASCKSHQKKVSRAILAYTEDYDGLFPYNWRPLGTQTYLDWALRVGRVPDDYNEVPIDYRWGIENTICITGYLDYIYTSDQEGNFKCPAFVDQVEPRATYAGACSSQFSINGNLCKTFEGTEDVVCTQIADVRDKAVMIGDGTLSAGGGNFRVNSQFPIVADGSLAGFPSGPYPYDFGPWTHQDRAGYSGVRCDFYGHTKEKAILTYVSGHTRAVRKIVHADWQITEPEPE